ncbi:MAG TPA: GntR family transcriptional regulator [Magnetospirillaceae bacterium]|nr:GntR family transcriptional regulator [Magnetospirillaceae bacterium]
MNFHVDDASGVPVYLQLKEQVLHAISRAQLKPGDQLPTVREVAVDLLINPNTVNRAYAELEREGLLRSRRGRGTFVSEAGKHADVSTQETRLADIARRTLGEARSYGFTPRDVLRAVAQVAREDRRGARK